MSLDVYLYYRQPRLSEIVDDKGQKVPYTKLYDALGTTNRELEFEDNIVFEYNITHNLNTMAQEAGIYEYLWHPESLNITTAKQLIDPLLKGYRLLLSDRERLKAFNPPNGWGSYEGLVKFVKAYYDACYTYPSAKIAISR
jgi:hypothetical protein